MDELPAEAARCFEERGRAVVLQMGDILRDTETVLFVMSGAIGIFPTAESSCVGLIGPGGIHGLDRCFAPSTNEHLMTLLKAEVVEVSAQEMVLATGRVWTERMFGHQATGRLRLMAAEASCGTRHTVVRRTARWLVRLGEASAFGRKINITQGVLAHALGVQRTTANAALCLLQERRLISTVRGSITLLSYGGLREIACDCGRSASPMLRQAEADPVEIDLPGALNEATSFARP